MRLALKTLAAIDAAMTYDQGSRFRHFLREAMPHAEDAYREDEEEFRSHLGASLIGRECTRELWYSFHWATVRKFDGRMLRLFNRGHLEEPRMVALLRTIGCTVYQHDENGKQFRIKGYKGHYGGGMDGVVVGCPDIPDEPVLGEFKTHNDKSFQKLKADGVISSKWEHFIQCQEYMGKNGLRFALYMATNKNDDEIHAELITFDPSVYERTQLKVIKIIDATEPPPKINESPGFFKCKFCDQSPVCHQTNVMPAINCRTCLASEVRDDGQWFCLAVAATLTKEEQLRGCSGYQMNPAFKA